ncbi:sulfur carrier protein ThiS [Nocardia sp. NPDC050435]|uniref:sulfur carrier protein ThiS n=1 Tax=Nocardia sp. NPDC050435 TaxID=3155040 RepID=UPI00340D29ED
MTEPKSELGQHTITVTVNGEQHHLTAPLSITDFLDGAGYPAEAVSVSVGDQVVPQDDWSTYALTDGLSLRVVTLTPGG